MDSTQQRMICPHCNIRKIYEVEQYHHKLASILDKQFNEERKSIEAEMLQIREKLYNIQKRIQDPGIRRSFFI